MLPKWPKKWAKLVGNGLPALISSRKNRISHHLLSFGPVLSFHFSSGLLQTQLGFSHSLAIEGGTASRYFRHSILPASNPDPLLKGEALLHPRVEMWAVLATFCRVHRHSPRSLPQSHSWDGSAAPRAGPDHTLSFRAPAIRAGHTL
eukprot:EG_transcript_35579